MARRFGWGHAHRAQLREAVQAFNIARKEAIKIAPGLKKVLSRALMKEYQARITSEKELKQTIKDLKKFSTATPEKRAKIRTTRSGVKISNWERDILRNKIRRINYERRKQVEQGYSTKKGNMGTIEKNQLEPLKFNLEKIPEKQIKTYIDSIWRREQAAYKAFRLQLFKNNYLKAFDAIFTGEYRIMAENVRNLIKNMSPANFYQAYLENPDILSIDFLYKHEEIIAKLEAIAKALEPYAGKKIAINYLVEDLDK